MVRFLPAALVSISGLAFVAPFVHGEPKHRAVVSVASVPAPHLDLTLESPADAVAIAAPIPSAPGALAIQRKATMAPPTATLADVTPGGAPGSTPAAPGCGAPDCGWAREADPSPALAGRSRKPVPDAGYRPALANSRGPEWEP